MANKRITDVDFIESLNGDESFFVNKNNSIKQINKNNITPANIGAAPASHTHTAGEVDAAPKNHTHTADEVGAAPASHTHTVDEIGAAPSSHTHTADEVGAISTTGGTMTGTLVMDGGDIIFKEGVNYGDESQRPAAGIKGRVYLQKVVKS